MKGLIVSGSNKKTKRKKEKEREECLFGLGYVLWILNVSCGGDFKKSPKEALQSKPTAQKVWSWIMIGWYPEILLCQSWSQIVGSVTWHRLIFKGSGGSFRSADIYGFRSVLSNISRTSQLNIIDFCGEGSISCSPLMMVICGWLNRLHGNGF